MRLAFEAADVAAILRKFKPEQLDALQVVIDVNSRQLSIEITGLKDAREFLAEFGMVEGKDYRTKDAILTAGEVILLLDEEDED